MYVTIAESETCWTPEVNHMDVLNQKKMGLAVLTVP